MATGGEVHSQSKYRFPLGTAKGEEVDLFVTPLPTNHIKSNSHPIHVYDLHNRVKGEKFCSGWEVWIRRVIANRAEGVGKNWWPNGRALSAIRRRLTAEW